MAKDLPHRRACGGIKNVTKPVKRKSIVVEKSSNQKKLQNHFSHFLAYSDLTGQVYMVKCGHKYFNLTNVN